MAVVNFVVFRDYNGKPMRNASVVMHPVEKTENSPVAGFSSRPTPRAKPASTVCPTASCGSRCWRSGFQTYGDDYAIDKPTVEITVKMKRRRNSTRFMKSIPREKKDEPEREKQSEKDSKDKPQ